MKKYNIREYVVDCVEKEELSKCIMKMKYGFVIREDCTVNHVATPTKFSNYLANGIIPIYSSALKSFSEFDKNQQIGIVYDLNDCKNGLNSVLNNMDKPVVADEMKSKCKNAFDSYYSKDKYIREIADKLGRIIKMSKK